LKRVVVLGSTGTIGVQTLSVIGEFPEEYELVGISGFHNVRLFNEQIKTYSPQFVALPDENKATTVDPGNATLFSGTRWFEELLDVGDIDIVLIGIVGFAALPPTLYAINKGIDVAIASKEVLVGAGEMVMALAKDKGVSLFPVDSEHAAIHQCLRGFDVEEVSSITLTASGGPFLERDDLSSVTIEEALNHPNWKMGSKISIDSATMVNKGLEIIEAHWLFGLPYNKIKAVIHPQSIVHGMVELANGAVISQMGVPDMKVPILYAMSKGQIRNQKGDLFHLNKLHLDFYEPDLEKFRALQLAYQVGKEGGSWPIVFNGANEMAVDLFLKGKITFLKIVDLIETALNSHKPKQRLDLIEILSVDRWAREFVKEEVLK
jgi:1-deoxy-D-xylulose-5-phosphate reductoisomerase